uniref:Uncharacterized protein n=1 Tax=Peronospora matthiolae TaxID=2874970 RepID=A0AAV1URU6_9STRA
MVQPAATQLTEPSGRVLTHRVTELAQGQGCSSIVSVSWGASVGNVHSAAVPPWMVQTEEEYKQCNRRDQVASVSGLVTCQQQRKRRMAEGKRRDIFTELESKSEYGPDWLPNFGGVWQEGSRFKTKQAFRKAADMEKYASRLDRPYPSRFSLSDLPRQPRSPRVTPAVSQMGQCLSPQRPAVQQQSVVEVQQEIIIAPASETIAQNAKHASAIDVKKQLLIAQKERLRAKMAARKRSH